MKQAEGEPGTKILEKYGGIMEKYVAVRNNEKRMF